MAVLLFKGFFFFQKKKECFRLLMKDTKDCALRSAE